MAITHDHQTSLHKSETSETSEHMILVVGLEMKIVQYADDALLVGDCKISTNEKSVC